MLRHVTQKMGERHVAVFFLRSRTVAVHEGKLQRCERNQFAGARIKP